MSQNTQDCEQGDEGVMHIDMMMTTQVPLVGFYGKVDEFNIVELGLILADKFTPQCLTSIDDNADILNKIDNMGAQKVSEDYDNSITAQEKNRAQVLEAILRYDELRTAKMEKDELSQKV